MIVVGLRFSAKFTESIYEQQLFGWFFKYLKLPLCFCVPLDLDRSDWCLCCAQFVFSGADVTVHRAIVLGSPLAGYYVHWEVALILLRHPILSSSFNPITCRNGSQVVLASVLADHSLASGA